MKTETEIEQELLEVRRLLAKRRDAGSEDTDMLYGAQQALGWVIEKLKSPSKLETTIERVADWLEQLS
jgi:hypothetical protein